MNSPSSDTSKPTLVNAKGEMLFKNNCATCHNIFREMTDPALLGVTERGPWINRKKIYDWIHNPSKFMATNDYAKKLQGKYGVMMQAFPSLKEDDIDAILEYIKESESNQAIAYR